MPVSEITRQRNKVQAWIYIAGDISMLAHDIVFMTVQDFNKKYGTNFKNESTFLATIRRAYNYLGKSRHSLYRNVDKRYALEIKLAYQNRKKQYVQQQQQPQAAQQQQQQQQQSLTYQSKTKNLRNGIRIWYYISSPPLNVLVWHTGTFYPFSIDPIYTILQYAPFVNNAQISGYANQFIIFYSTYTYRIENPVWGITHTFTHRESSGVRVYQSFQVLYAGWTPLQILYDIFEKWLHNEHLIFIRNFAQNYSYYIYLELQEFTIMLEGTN